MTPIERSARAAYQRRWTISMLSWAQLSRKQREELTADQRAAIASLREPTKAMIDKAAQTSDLQAWQDIAYRPMLRNRQRAAFVAAIEAALAEGEEMSRGDVQSR